MADFSDQYALVTGATSGIGRATALALAARGATVAVSGRDGQRGRAVVRQITARGGKAEFLPASLSDEPSARGLARAAVERYGHVDILVNNAAIYPIGPTEAMTETDYESIFGLNLKAPFFLVAELAPAMAARGGGAIINVSTVVSQFALPGFALYGASKAALNILTKFWAAEYGSRGVRVNAVIPGTIRTEGTSHFIDELESAASESPAGRVGSPQEVADAIVFLAGPNASYINGALLPVDGGRMAI